MLVKLKVDYHTSKKGDLVEVSPALGKMLISKGTGEQHDKSAKASEISNAHFFDKEEKAKKQAKHKEKAQELKQEIQENK